MSAVDFNKYHCGVIRENIRLLDRKLADLVADNKIHSKEYFDAAMTKVANEEVLQKLEAEAA